MKQEMTFNLSLNEKEVNFILSALGELPAKHSMGMIGNIQMQCQKQMEPAKKTPVLDCK